MLCLVWMPTCNLVRDCLSAYCDLSCMPVQLYHKLWQHMMTVALSDSGCMEVAYHGSVAVTWSTSTPRWKPTWLMGGTRIIVCIKIYRGDLLECPTQRYRTGIRAAPQLWGPILPLVLVPMRAVVVLTMP